MLKVLGKSFYTAIFIGTTLPINANIQGAKADSVDNFVIQCQRAAAVRRLSSQEIKSCRRAIYDQRDRNIRLDNWRYKVYQDSQQQSIKDIKDLAKPTVPF
jgi:uncharacterized protein YcsI (UPF0317 family)